MDAPTPTTPPYSGSSEDNYILHAPRVRIRPLDPNFVPPPPMAPLVPPPELPPHPPPMNNRPSSDEIVSMFDNIDTFNSYPAEFLRFLAYCSARDMSRQLQFNRSRVCDPQWQEVIDQLTKCCPSHDGYSHTQVAELERHFYPQRMDVASTANFRGLMREYVISSQTTATSPIGFIRWVISCAYIPHYTVNILTSYSSTCEPFPEELHRFAATMDLRAAFYQWFCVCGLNAEQLRQIMIMCYFRDIRSNILEDIRLIFGPLDIRGLFFPTRDVAEFRICVDSQHLITNVCKFLGVVSDEIYALDTVDLADRTYLISIEEKTWMRSQIETCLRCGIDDPSWDRRRFESRMLWLME